MSTGEPGSVSERSLKAERELLSSSAIRALAEERWNKSRPWIDWPLLVVFILVITALFAPLGSTSIPVPGLDSISAKTVRAERNLVIEDAEATALRREQALATIRPQFDHNRDILFERREAAVAALDRLHERKADTSLDLAARRAAFEADLGLPVNGTVFELLEGLPDAEEVTAALTFFINSVIDRMIVTDVALLPVQGGIDLWRPGAERAVPKLYHDDVLDLAQAWRLMRARAREAPYGEARILRTWILETALAVVEPNLMPNDPATAAAREAALDSVEPVVVRIGRGEVVVREGDRVSAHVQARVRALNDASEGGLGWVDSVAFAALLAGLVGLGAYFFRRARDPLMFSRKESYITLAALTLTSLASIAALYGGRGIAEGFGIEARTAAFLCPVALAPVILSVIVNARTSLMVGVALSLLVAYRADGDIWLAAYYLIGVLVAGIVARRCRHRTDLLKVGLIISLAHVAAAPVAIKLGGTAAGLDYLVMVIFALISGGLVAVLAMGLMPLFENVFDEVTDVKLMEMASGDHPLLKRLALHSPGTYHHSVMMANLAEAAADAIGANGLQCRVMALYHDIGKTVRPVYFAENQRDGNIHDGLPPELSARIIFSHITDGIGLARQHKLGRPVIDAVTQHQGTTLLRVFYKKAVELASASGQTVDEQNFRYPGPRPRTRESGILMLADSVEAATRALSKPSPAEVAERVTKVVKEKIDDGQLNDCALTIADLAAVEEAFSRVLVLGVFHSRIEYPALTSVEGRGRDGGPGDEEKHESGSRSHDTRISLVD